MTQVTVPQMRFIYDETISSGNSFGEENEKRNRNSLKSLCDAFQSDIRKTTASPVDEKTYSNRTIFLSLGEYKSSALLLTSDGWIATNAHCIEHILPEWDSLVESRKNGNLIRRHKDFSIDISKYFAIINNKDYPIDIRYYSIDTAHDIAFIKARGSRLCKKIIFPWKESKSSLIVSNGKNYSQVRKNDGIRLYSKKDNLHSISAGIITDLSEDCEIDKNNTIFDTMATDSYARGGYSGGVVTSSDYQILGFTSFITPRSSDNEIGHANIVKVDYLIELIDSYVNNATKIIDVETRKPMAQFPHIARLLYNR